MAMETHFKIHEEIPYQHRISIVNLILRASLKSSESVYMRGGGFLSYEYVCDSGVAGRGMDDGKWCLGKRNYWERRGSLRKFITLVLHLSQVI